MVCEECCGVQAGLCNPCCFAPTKVDAERVTVAICFIVLITAGVCAVGGVYYWQLAEYSELATLRVALFEESVDYWESTARPEFANLTLIDYSVDVLGGNSSQAIPTRQLTNTTAADGVVYSLVGIPDYEALKYADNTQSINGLRFDSPAVLDVFFTAEGGNGRRSVLNTRINAFFNVQVSIIRGSVEEQEEHCVEEENGYFVAEPEPVCTTYYRIDQICVKVVKTTDGTWQLSGLFGGIGCQRGVFDNRPWVPGNYTQVPPGPNGPPNVPIDLPNLNVVVRHEADPLGWGSYLSNGRRESTEDGGSLVTWGRNEKNREDYGLTLLQAGVLMAIVSVLSMAYCYTRVRCKQAGRRDRSESLSYPSKLGSSSSGMVGSGSSSYELSSYHTSSRITTSGGTSEIDMTTSSATYSR